MIATNPIQVDQADGVRVTLDVPEGAQVTEVATLDDAVRQAAVGLRLVRRSVELECQRRRTALADTE